jgi:hypothetical protein
LLHLLGSGIGTSPTKIDVRYVVAIGGEAETWIVLQPIGSAWPDAAAKELWTRPCAHKIGMSYWKAIGKVAPRTNGKSVELWEGTRFIVRFPSDNG